MKYYWKKDERQKGQSLIEAVAALGVITIVLTALTIAVLLGLRNSEFTRKETIATQYAQQGMETIRNLRDTSWTTFNISSAFRCLDSANGLTDASCPASGCSTAMPFCTAIAAGFIRDVQYDRGAASCNGGTKVTVTTWWKDNKCSGSGYCRKARVVSCLVDTRAPTPG